MSTPLVVQCPYCTGPLIQSASPICEKCKVPHHYECWMENGGCTTFSCQNSPDVKRLKAEGQ